MVVGPLSLFQSPLTVKIDRHLIRTIMAFLLSFALAGVCGVGGEWSEIIFLVANISKL
jgi:hypothetical protein